MTHPKLKLETRLIEKATHSSIDKRLRNEVVSFEGEDDGRGERIEISEGQQDRSNSIAMESSRLEDFDVVQVKFDPINVPSEMFGDKFSSKFLTKMDFNGFIIFGNLANLKTEAIRGQIFKWMGAEVS